MKPSANLPGVFPAVRRGVTLIELLVVIVILSIITAASIPMLTAGMEQRRVREAARLISSYISSAKSRAVETGRPSGVMIQRYTPAAINAAGGGLQSLPGYAMSLVMVDIPAPYSGDYTGSMALVQSQVFGTITYGVNPITNQGNTYTNVTCGIVTSLGSGPTAVTGGTPAGTYFNGSADMAWSGLVRVGDLIRFGYQGRWYVILGTSSISATTPTSASSPASLNWGLTNSGTASNPIFLSAPPITTTPYPTVSGGTPPTQAPWVVFAIDGSGAVPASTSTGMPYQILRQPVKAAVPPLQLPEGVVIDLENSGVGITGTYLGGEFDGSTGSTTPPLYPNPILTFYPTGLVGFIYSGFNPPQHLPSALYLLIGRRDGMSDVNPNNTGTYHPTVKNTNFSSGVPLPIDPNNLPNLYDMNNLWVAISPQSGLVVTTENASMTMAIAAQQINGFTPPEPQANVAMYQAARGFAQTATSMGGK